jgi:uncharacterized repeat protein (TIGR02543 family)
MKRFCFFLLGVIFFGAVLDAWAVPPLPHTFYGTVKQDGTNVPNGTVVSAWIGGIQYISTTTIMSGVDSVYTFNVPGDDSDSPAKDGGVNGDTIHFNVGNEQVATASFSSGATTGLNLSVVGRYALTISISPSGAGTVSKNPDKNAYSFGEQVTLTATPGSGFTFSNWSGDGSGTTNPINVTMNTNKTLTANFTQGPPTRYTLTVNITGSGSVTKNPDKPTYNQGEQVILMATPSSGFSFSSWSGDASGTTNPVTLTMNGNKTVMANFTAVAGNLVVSLALA